VIIQDLKLKEHVEKVILLMGSLEEELRPVCALLDAYHWHFLIEGEASTLASEALQLLRSPELRPALRQWYRKYGDDMNPGALEFRERLRGLTGETLG